MLVSTDAYDRHESPVTLVAGMRAFARMQSRISSESARVGDEFQATLTDPWLLGSRVVVPAGTRVLGEVSEVEPTGRGKHKARLVLRFTRLEPEDGEPVPLEAALIGGGALVGGIVGKITGNAGRGAVLGAAAGTGAAVATKGEPVVIRPGRALRVVLQRDVRIPVPSTRS
ncbi:MAG: TrbI/VirB10 family protein [Candidatus Eisenbacteria bacterium]|nr:TrbI/VirB10 family protein [Candidatus Eisenbacteria bacterium]